MPETAGKNRGDSPRPRRERWTGAILLAAPAALALALTLGFASEGSAHGDAAHYRKMGARCVAEGQLPLAPLEWFHPGFYGLVAALNRALGDLVLSHRLLSWGAWSFFAWVAAGVWRRWLPESRLAGPATAGMVMLLPAALWLMQDTMSDLTGTALVGAAALMVLGGEREKLRPFFIAGLLFGTALTIRVSSAAFLPLLASFWWWRPRLRPARGGAAFAFIVGSVLPIALVAGRILLDHPVATVFEVLRERSADNHWGYERLRAATPNLGFWPSHHLRGVSPYGLTAGLAGWALVIAAGRSRRWMLGPLVVGLLYPLALIFNRSTFEFRYQLPLMSVIVLGAPMLIARVESFRPRLGQLLLLTLLIAQVGWALPWLEGVAARPGFVRSGAREAVADLARDPGVFAGETAAAWFDLEPGAGPFFVLGPESAERDREARRWFRKAVGHGQRALTIDEPGSAWFRRSLRERGWRVETRRVGPAGAYRHREDAHWILFEPACLRVDRPLELESWRPPFSATRLDATSEGLRLRINAPAHAGREVLILAFHEDPSGARISFGDVGLPARDDDILRGSLAADLRLRLDEAGQGLRLFVEGQRPILTGAWRLVGLVLAGGDASTATFLLPIK